MAEYKPKTLEELSQQAGVETSVVQDQLNKYPGLTKEVAIGNVLSLAKKGTPGVSMLSTKDAISQVKEDKKKFDEYTGTPTTYQQAQTTPQQATTALETTQKEPEENKENTYTFDEAVELWGKDFTGLRRNEDGTFTPDETALSRLGIEGLETDEGNTLEQAVANVNDQIESFVNDLTTYNVDDDLAYKDAAANIRAKYEKMRQEMIKINKSREQAYEALGYSSGMAQYAGSTIMGVMGEELNQANERLAEISRQESEAISAARSAYQKGKYEEFNTKINALDVIRDNKAQELENYNAKLAEAIKAQQEQAKFELDVFKAQTDRMKLEGVDPTIQASRDTAVASLYAQGITDPVQMLSYLNYDEQGNMIGDFTLEQISDSLGFITGGKTQDIKTIGNATTGYFQYNSKTGGWDKIIEGQTTRTRDDLTPMELLQARNLSVQIFGKRGGIKPENIKLVEDLMAGGMNVDKIQDELRYSTQSEGFEEIRNIAQFVLKSGYSAIDRQSNMDYLDDLMESGDINSAKEFIFGLARDKASQSELSDVVGREEALYALDSIENLLYEFTKKGGKTNLISGNIEKIQQKILKQTGNEELARIGNEIAVVIQRYRQQLTGAAFTESEAKEYRELFPNIEKTPELNQAKIDSMRKIYQRNQDLFYKRQLGSTNYSNLMNLGSSEMGIDYEKEVLNAVNKGEINIQELIQQMRDSGIEPTYENMYQLKYGDLGFNSVGGDTNIAVVSMAMVKPDGSKGGQCGAFVNKLTGLGLGDSYQSKMAKMDKTIKTPQAGMVFVMPYKDTGHTGIILSVNNGIATVKDSNYSLDEKVKTHTIPVSEMTGFKYIT